MRVELRRGSLVLAVLGALREERYGYTLRRTLEDAGLLIDEGALYPLLRRLESQGLLISEWREEAKRTKRFYRLSPDGTDTLAHSSTNGTRFPIRSCALPKRTNKMDLIDRYLAAIARRLPAAKADDIVAEIRD